MINAVIVEDEFMVAKRLTRFVTHAFAEQPMKLVVLNTLDDADDYLASHNIDVLFLDLNLQGKDGFKLLKDKLCESFHTIVVSANSDRAIEAFDLGVLDFVAKPFTQERIQKAIDRLLDKTHVGMSKYLTYKQLGKTQLLAIEEISYLKADGHYTHIITSNGQEILHDKNLDKLLTTLPQHFIRTHRSYAVPLNHMKSIEAHAGSKYWLNLHSGESLPIGRTRVAQLREKMC